MIRCSEIIEKPIFDNKTNEMFAVLYDIVFKKNSDEILGFVWKKKMLMKDFGIILFNDILLASRDGLRAKNKNKYKNFNYNNSLYFGLSYKHDFSNKIVLNRNGELIGIVRDLLLNMDNGRFQSFEFSEGYIDDFITGRKLIASESGYRIDSNAVTLFNNDAIQEKGRGLLNRNKFT